MSGYDIIAWVTLVIVIGLIGYLAVYLASLPGRIARRRVHPWAEGVAMAGWLFFFLGFALWPLTIVWAYVDAPRRAKGSDGR